MRTVEQKTLFGKTISFYDDNDKMLYQFSINKNNELSILYDTFLHIEQIEYLKNSINEFLDGELVKINIVPWWLLNNPKEVNISSQTKSNEFLFGKNGKYIYNISYLCGDENKNLNLVEQPNIYSIIYNLNNNYDSINFFVENKNVLYLEVSKKDEKSYFINNINVKDINLCQKNNIRIIGFMLEQFFNIKNVTNIVGSTIPFFTNQSNFMLNSH
jgi:hypothetical protein